MADDEDALTLPELLTTITEAVWEELDSTPAETYTARKPYVSSLRRNLQRQHVELLTDLMQAGGFSVAAYKPISDLVLEQMYEIKQTYCDKVLRTASKNLDPYTRAHLKDVRMRIEKALDAQYVMRSL